MASPKTFRCLKAYIFQSLPTTINMPYFILLHFLIAYNASRSCVKPSYGTIKKRFAFPGTFKCRSAVFVTKPGKRWKQPDLTLFYPLSSSSSF